MNFSRIDLGCGRNKKEGFFGVDCQQLPEVDLVCDCNYIIPILDNVADEVNAVNFLEHVNNDKRIHIMNEVWRILKPGGYFYSYTPSSDGRGAFQDPTHYSFWNENSFLYYSDDEYRALYSITANFSVLDIHTTPINSSGICFVEAMLMAVK